MGSYTFNHGAVIRAPLGRRQLSLVFTGGHFGEGFETVLDTLGKHGVPGSFYFTGDFLANADHIDLLRRALFDGHVVGPHSHAHPLYCPWEDRTKTLITREDFLSDLERNLTDLRSLGVPEQHLKWWIPPYEWYNDEIAGWAREAGHPLFSFTPGTLSNADYTEDDAKNYRPNQLIWDSIVAHEVETPDGLNGFLLLTHVGAGPRRTEKFFERLDDLIVLLLSKGYQFSSIVDILKDCGDGPD
ncbi:MAG: polysaccharide deacetylase family protein [Candidatus Sumerlaeia bacterium]|nr:polysaccharide deacetylase family protein [Candidatus Sumerlaeia bacterium]